MSRCPATDREGREAASHRVDGEPATPPLSRHSHGILDQNVASGVRKWGGAEWAWPVQCAGQHPIYKDGVRTGEDRGLLCPTLVSEVGLRDLFKRLKKGPN